MQAGRFLNIIFLIFAVLGGIDYFLDNRFGIGKEFERGIQCSAELILCMVGFMTLAPFIGDILQKICGPLLEKTGADPSLLAGILFSIDCGGAPAAQNMSLSKEAAILNGYFVASMFGSAIGGNVVLSLLAVKKEQRGLVLFGLAVGFATIPAGCIIGAFMVGISAKTVFFNMLPLMLLAALLIGAMILCTNALLVFLKGFGKMNVALCVLGLLIAAAGELCGFEVLPARYPFTEIMTTIGQIVLVLTGVFPFMGIFLKLFDRRIESLSCRTGLSLLDIKGLIMDSVNCFSSIRRLPEMTDMGIVLNTAFGVGGGYALGDHFAYAASTAPELVLPLIAAKLGAGAVSIAACVLLRKYILPGKR